MGFLESILETVLFPITPIIDPIINLAAAFVKLGALIVNLLKAVPKVVEIILMLADPIKLIKDIIFGFSTGIYMVLDAVIDMIFGDIRKAIGGNTESGSNKGTMDEKGKCMPPSIVKILLLVLCPPLSILLERGLAGIIYVFLCCLLTYFYYIPGLIYACLYVLC